MPGMKEILPAVRRKLRLKSNYALSKRLMEQGYFISERSLNKAEAADSQSMVFATQAALNKLMGGDWNKGLGRLIDKAAKAQRRS